MPADRREHWLKMLAVEGYVATTYAEAMEGMNPGDDVFIAEFEYDLED